LADRDSSSGKIRYWRTDRVSDRATIARTTYFRASLEAIINLRHPLVVGD